MDETHFTHKSRSPFMKLVRMATTPLRRTFFLRTGEDPTLGNRVASWLLSEMGY
jgi:hypothetical protein